MDKSGLVTQQISVRRHDEDRLSNLPESLLCQIMSNLRTNQDVVKSCVLSKRWRNIWRYVPALDVDYFYFRDYNALMSFVYKFLALNRESCFQSCRLGCCLDDDKTRMLHLRNWIEIVIDRKVKNLHISDQVAPDDGFELPPAIYTCESLVYLDLGYIILTNPMSISLPFLKVIKLYMVKFADDMDLEKLISSCPVLESVCMTECILCDIQFLRVCSQSLLSFKLLYCRGDDEGLLKVEIDAPKLEYLRLSPSINGSFRLKRLESLVVADLNIVFDNDPSDHLMINNMIRDLLLEISCVKKLFIHADTTEKIYDFRNDDADDEVEIVSMPKCLLTSLEYVEIETAIIGTKGMKQVSYFLENSAILKKLTLRLGRVQKEDPAFLKKLFTIARLAPLCQVVVLN